MKALLFSGGIDSTYEALTLKGKLHLVTFHNGYGQFFINRSYDRFRELKSSNLTYEVLSVKPIFKKILLDTLDEDMHYGGFVWCLSCKLAMHTRMILFCKEKGIKTVHDGSSADTSEMVEQSQFAKDMIRELYNLYSIEFMASSYSVPREKKIAFLKRKGISTGIPLFGRNMGIQPKCIPGELYYSPYILCGKKPHHDQKDVADFFDKKIPLIKEMIKID
ncbi:MAG: hypothetical protein R6V53_07185 [Candidatus Woesearchaeota archaeon]